MIRNGIVTKHRETHWLTTADVEGVGEIEFSSMAFHHGAYPPRKGDRLEMSFRGKEVVSVANLGRATKKES